MWNIVFDEATGNGDEAAGDPNQKKVQHSLQCRVEDTGYV
jgi:hypothetical protein